MRKRVLYGLGLILLVVLSSLVLWQGSFTFGDYAPSSPQQVYLFWGISTLIFLLTVILSFILLRTGIKLYVERRGNRQGSRIKFKLVAGALALTFLPVFFLVVWSVHVLNRNLEKWFSRPAENVKLNLAEVGAALEIEAASKALAQARFLATLEEVAALRQGPQGGLAGLCSEQGIESAWLEGPQGARQEICRGPEAGPRAAHAAPPVGRAPLRADRRWTVVVRSPLSIELAEKQRAIQAEIEDYNQLTVNRKEARSLYIRLLLLITLFILFVATWLALFMARQISVPISALLQAAGEIRKGNLAYRVHVDAIDELATLVASFNEMTRDLEANSRELEQRRRFTETILESIPTGVISITADGRIRKVNRALRQMFPAAVDAQRLEEFLPRDEAAEIRYLMKRARRTGVSSRQLELKQNGHTAHLGVTVSALEDSATSGFVVVLEETSELLRAQKAAAWHEVARRIAHEIKNPLTPIALCAERIARHLERQKVPADLKAIVRECTSTIAKEVESVKTLVDEFSRFSRFPAAQMAPADLNEIVENALAVFAGRLDEIQIRKDLDPNLPPVNADREQFKRLVVNLVDNAAEAMLESPVKVLYVSTRGAGDAVGLIVEDTGCGISPADKERLFLPYFSTKGRGTGLGLAIVSQIVAEHGGEIRVEDNHPYGARFIVEIPVMAPEPAPVVEAQE